MALKTPNLYYSTAALVGWWDASGGISGLANGANVPSFPDKTANAYNQTQATGANQPTYNATGGPSSQGALSLNQTWLEANVPSGSFNYTPSGGPTALGLTFVSLWKATGSPQSPAAPFNRTAGNQPVPIDSNSTNRVIGSPGAYAVYSDAKNLGSDPLFTDWNIFVQTLDNGLFSEYINGTLVYQVTAPYYGEGTSALTLGSRNDAATRMIGFFVEGYVRVGKPADADRQYDEGYLAWHSDGATAGTIVGKLPANHPYKTAAPSTTTGGSNYTGSVADTGSGSDTSTAKAATAASATDTGTGSDTRTASVAASASSADTGTGSDTATGSASRAGSTTDPGTGSDTASASASVPRSATDAGTSSDAVSASAAALGQATDTGTGTDAASATAATPGGVADTGTGSDASTGASGSVLTGSVSDAGTASDAATARAAVPGSATDTGTGFDTSGSTAAASGSANDAGSATDTRSATAGVAGSSADAGTGSDATSVFTGGLVAANDTGTGADTASASAAGLAAVKDTGSGVDTVSASIPGMSPAAPRRRRHLLLIAS